MAELKFSGIPVAVGFLEGRGELLRISPPTDFLLFWMDTEELLAPLGLREPDWKAGDLAGCEALGSVDSLSL